MRSRPLSLALRAFVSAALFGALVWWAGPRQLLAALAGVDGRWLALAAVLSYVSIALGTGNVYVLSRSLRPGIPLSRVSGAYLRSWVVGMLAPGKLGDLSYAHFISAGDGYSFGLAVSVVDKLITFAVMSIVACAGLLLFIGAADAALAAAFAVVVMGTAVAVLASKRARRLVRERVLRDRAAHFAGFSADLRALARDRTAMALNVALTVSRLLLNGLTMLAGLKAFAQTARWLPVVFIQAISNLAMLVPVTFSGLGIKQGASVVLFRVVEGIPQAPVLDLHLALLAVSFVTTSVTYLVLGLGKPSAEKPDGVSPADAESVAP